MMETAAVGVGPGSPPEKSARTSPVEGAEGAEFQETLIAARADLPAETPRDEAGPEPAPVPGDVVDEDGGEIPDGPPDSESEGVLEPARTEPEEFVDPIGESPAGPSSVGPVVLKPGDAHEAEGSGAETRAERRQPPAQPSDPLPTVRGDRASASPGGPAERTAPRADLPPGGAAGPADSQAAKRGATDSSPVSAGEKGAEEGTSQRRLEAGVSGRDEPRPVEEDLSAVKRDRNGAAEDGPRGDRALARNASKGDESVIRDIKETVPGRQVRQTAPGGETQETVPGGETRRTAAGPKSEPAQAGELIPKRNIRSDFQPAASLGERPAEEVQPIRTSADSRDRETDQGKGERARMFNESGSEKAPAVSGHRGEGLIGSAGAPPEGTVPLTESALSGRVPPGPAARGPQISEIFSQVVENTKINWKEDRGEIRIRLNPPHLGGLRIRIVVEGKRVRALIHAQNPQVGEMLGAQAPELRQSFLQHGLRLDEITVSANGDQANGSEGWQEAGPGWREEREGPAALRETSLGETALEAAAPPVSAGSPGLPGQVNVFA